MCQSLRLTDFRWFSLSFAFEDIINQRTYTSIMGQAAESLNLALSGSYRRRNHRIVCAFGENLGGFSQKP